MSVNRRKQLHIVKQLVKAYVRELQKSGFDVSRVFLYGSYARGDSHKGSDIDVCVVSRNYKPESDRTRLFLWQKRRDVDARIEPIGYRPEDFQDTDPLVYEIKKHGVRIT